MSLVKNEKKGPNTYELELAIAAQPLKEEISKVFRREGKKYNVPGFRKGHAPRNLIEKMYGADVFVFDAVNDMFPDVYEQALEETGLEPVARPEVELVSASAEEGAVLLATVTVAPELKIGEYTGIAATKYVKTVSDEEVEQSIEGMRQRNSRITTREGAAVDGDIATIDYEGSVDGVPFEGGKGENYRLTLGSGQFIPGFEEQVVGHAAGEDFDVNVTFPTEYHSEELAGKEAVFKVHVSEVQQKELPEVDDEFAKDVSEYDTLSELKDSIRKEMQEQSDEQADKELENVLVDMIVETIEGEIPEVMYETRMDEMVRDFAFRLEQQGMNLEMYMQYTGMDMASFREGFKEQAEKQVKMRLALETVVRLENIVTTDEDLDAEVARIAEKYKMEEEKVREVMPVKEISKDLAVNKAIDLIKSKAAVTEKDEKDRPSEEEAQEPAPKKKAAKSTKKAASKEKSEPKGE